MSLWNLAQRFRGIASGAEAAKELAGRSGLAGLEQIERMKQHCYEVVAREIEQWAREMDKHFSNGVEHYGQEGKSMIDAIRNTLGVPEDK